MRDIIFLNGIKHIVPVEVVIPYGSVLDLYCRELSPLIEERAVRFCVCGCQRRVYGRKQYATRYCRNKAYRERSETSKRGSEKPIQDKGFSVTI